ncbi:MAG: hypothetical protein COV34_03410 [Candidatus Zambryskibacteria bacterium CG10_big_fil_rev_8_21_14_0_10_42_12]|uniref:DNA-formamidopyrimidine glycosylase n=1 Tax=Candidatus Zambryskibacteria bacterium CG10_big_fil_rev_8_21_14_0_10_42_12 TaxID=1975115 RepID=A0A2H0QSL9_9BACT|nr:MAG: hypothetical protein COV34_03410 [Candidatus Zambryskibacteria bacterium CG10_big_fil_rev_8_21_14_0_10_42_12]
MPELPEVTTTVNGIKKEVVGLSITDVWTDYFSPLYTDKEHIKDKNYFSYFKKQIIGAKIVDAERRAKNILIHLDNNKTILIHMKMTGHIMYGPYRRSTPKEKRETKETWLPVLDGSLKDPFNRFIHLVFTLSNNKHLVMSDVRKFGKVIVIETGALHSHKDLHHLGPEPLETSFGFKDFKEVLLKKPNGKIKQVLMDQSVIAGIGNIYSDEILYEADVHPLSTVSKIRDKNLKKMFDSIKNVLSKGIDFGGDSTSDYRNIYGESGTFHHHHKVYRETGKPCPKKGCPGTIKRISLGGRGAHFCDTHQILY